MFNKTFGEVITLAKYEGQKYQEKAGTAKECS